MRSPPVPVAVLRGQPGNVSSLAFAGCDRPEQLAVGSTKGDLQIWNSCTMRSIVTLPCDDRSSINSVGFLGRADLLFSQHGQGYLKLWDVRKKGDCIKKLKLGKSSLCRATSVLEGKYICAPCDEESCLGIVDVSLGRLVRTVNPNSHASSTEQKFGMCMCLCESSVEGQVWMGFENGSLLSCSVTEEPPQIIQKLHVAREPLISCTSDNRTNTLVVGGVGKRISCVQYGQRNNTFILEHSSTGANEVCLRPDGRILAAALWDGGITIWRWSKSDSLTSEKCSKVGTLRFHEGAARTLSFSADSRFLASGGESPGVALWCL